MVSKPALLPAAPKASTLQAVPRVREMEARDAVARLHAALQRVEAQGDPLARHLGYRALNRDDAVSGFDPQRLHGTEQVAARTLLEQLRAREQQTFVALDDAARADLEVVFRCEERHAERAALATRRAKATVHEAVQRAAAERLQRDLERQGLTLATLPREPRPAWMRTAGLGFVVFGFAVLAVLARHPRELDALAPAWRWAALVSAGLGVVLGTWLRLDPRERRAWVLSQRAKLTAWSDTAAERELHALERLGHARELCDEVEAQCQRAEAAAHDVAVRRPAVEPFLR